MRYLAIIGSFLVLAACSGSGKTHSVKVIKPVYHHTWYKNSRWHKKIQVGRVRIRWFEKQGVKTVRMY
jgi:hypothetical protein